MIRKFIPSFLIVSAIFLLNACIPAQKAEEAVQQPQDSNADTKSPEVSVQTEKSAGKYIAYSESAYNESSGKKRVLFFHAPWCPYCKAADKVFNANLDRIPEDVILFKTDYDTEKALKTKYAVTYQHTFVYVDADGKKINIWNGGDIDELINNTK